MAIKYPLSLVVQAVDKATVSVRRINARMAKLTQPIRVPLMRLGNSLSALSTEAGLPKLGEGFKGVGSSVGRVGREVLALGRQLAGLAVLAGGVFGVFLKGAVDAGDELATVADRLGFSVNGFASLQYAAAQADVDAKQFTDGMDQLNKRMGDLRAGGGPLLSFLQKVSPTMLQQVKATKSTEEAFFLLTRGFQRLTDPAKRAALGAAAFGRGAKQMSQFAGLGEAAINAYRQRFVELSGDQEAFARGAGDVDNAMREAQTAFLGLRNAAAGALFPAITQLSKALADFLAKNRDGLQRWATGAGAAISAWIQGGGLERLGQSLGQIATTTGRVVDALGGLKGVAAITAAVLGSKLLVSLGGLVGSLWQLGSAVLPVVWRALNFVGPLFLRLATFIMPILGKALLALGGVLVKFGIALLTTPVGWFMLAIAAIAGIAYLIYKNWAPISGFFTKLWGGVVDVVQEKWGAIRDFFKGLWQDITGFFQRAWEKIKPIVDVMMKVAEISPLGLAVKAGQQAADWWSSRGSKLETGATSAALPAATSTEARVVVDFTNMPRGTRVSEDPSGTAPLDLSMGYSMATP